ncbi:MULTISPECIES: efflux RND transporter periplasmic adaptor subunit [unclassified Flavobacterium]|uniref:efflux RND transporter periplasmic adaptor subunit n=1 Tax=unclassified Flavobacterium TaxID=196869 RepID=UPI000868CA4A|nr:MULTISPECIES: efflux RND transporter periplasmic adaptor subunit [unclassified Flavobacterium]MBN9284441.1 efflux RND transporter periplasmic adaptor subunit [Flavobacterium sp.]ODS80957.1 MAG: efflux transporter periplasmic adaptor subunit [Chryseobacterium sp. SCN 40-13]OJV72742.1 MAG: efflux transporter periplasmic adaptor subunit [Flavobacterium sp. 40-81]
MKHYILIFTYLFLLTGCSNKKETPETAAGKTVPTVVSLTATQIKNAGIASALPVVQDVQGSLLLQGSVSVPPQSTVSLSFPLGGYLKHTAMLPGMYVRKGQVLATMEDIQFIQLQQDFLTAKERFLLADKEYKRQKGLNESKASSDKVAEQAHTERQTQQIDMASLAQKLRLIGINPEKLNAASISKTVAIVSPITGLVAKVNVNVGKYTAPTDVLFELVDTKDLLLTLNVFEKNVDQVSIGQTVMAYSNNDRNKKYKASIQYINTTLNSDGAMELICKFEKIDAALLPGLFMQGEVAVRNNKGLSVPEDAVVRWQNRYYVFTEQKEGTYTMIPVDLGNAHNGIQQIIASSIQTNSKIVVKNAYTLLTKLMNSTEE